MKTSQIAENFGFKLLAGNEGVFNEVKELYCCDLLSWAMAKATEESMWFTVMGNMNTVAVASLKDVSCIVLTENAGLDDTAKLRADQNDIPVYQTELSTAEALIKVHEYLKNEV